MSNQASDLKKTSSLLNFGESIAGKGEPANRKRSDTISNNAPLSSNSRITAQFTHDSNVNVSLSSKKTNSPKMIANFKTFLKKKEDEEELKRRNSPERTNNNNSPPHENTPPAKSSLSSSLSLQSSTRRKINSLNLSSEYKVLSNSNEQTPTLSIPPPPPPPPPHVHHKHKRHSVKHGEKQGEKHSDKKHKKKDHSKRKSNVNLSSSIDIKESKEKDLRLSNELSDSKKVEIESDKEDDTEVQVEDNGFEESEFDETLNKKIQELNISEALNSINFDEITEDFSITSNLIKELIPLRVKRKSNQNIQSPLVSNSFVENQLFANSIRIHTSPQDHFDIHKLIGKGAYGKVYKATDKKTKELVALKSIPLATDHDADDRKLSTELQILNSINCANVVAYRGSYLIEDELWIAMEFCEVGSLGDLITKSNVPLDEAELAAVVVQILRGLVYLHDSNIIHRDIKGDNVLVTSDGLIKLGLC